MYLRNAPLLVDHIGDALCELVFRRARSAIGHADFAIGIAEQRKWKAELLGEARVVLGVIEAGSEDLDVFRLVFVVEVPEPGTLGRSTGCVRFRKKPQHDLFAAEVAELHATSLVIASLKLRRRIADLQHSSTSSDRLPRVAQRSRERHAGIVSWHGLGCTLPLRRPRPY